MASLNNGSWSTGLCGCCDDVGSCCLTFFCPCVAFGRIAEIVDRGATSCCVSGTLCRLLASGDGVASTPAATAPRCGSSTGSRRSPAPTAASTGPASSAPCARSTASSRTAASTRASGGTPTWRRWGRAPPPSRLRLTRG